MSIDISNLWDFNNPEISEERFRAALSISSADESLMLQTQIARTYGLRRDFNKARQILSEIKPQIQQAGIEAQVRYHLELGRTYCSAAHKTESQTDAVKALARSEYLLACKLAQDGNLDSLAIDALHMMAFVDNKPDQQIEWNNKAIVLMQASSQPDAKKWEGSLHNNNGYALHSLGQYDDALKEFKLALAAYQRDGDPAKIRIAHWMIAWTLRSLGHFEEAIALQLRLAKECDKGGEPDAYVFEELEILYHSINENEKAAHYAFRRKAIT